MYLITYLRDLFYSITNKKIGRYETDSKRENKNLKKQPTHSDLTFLSKIYDSETFIRKEMDQWIPQNVSMKYFSDRMKTFKNWPKQIVQQPKELAQAGFYYIGEGDKVKCFYCGLVLYNWLTCDNPVCEHKQHGFTCKFIHVVYGTEE